MRPDLTFVHFLLFHLAAKPLGINFNISVRFDDDPCATRQQWLVIAAVGNFRRSMDCDGMAVSILPPLFDRNHWFVRAMLFVGADFVLVDVNIFHRVFRFAVLAAFLNAAFVGAPFAPGLRIFSPLPAAMRLRLAWMFR